MQEQREMLQVDPRSVRVGALTPQERQCLRLVAQNRSSKEIAVELGISKASVDTYCNRARAKLGAANRRAAARLVAESDPAAAPATPPAPPPAPAAPTVHISLLPPLDRLGLWKRLVLILAGASMLALAFGMLLTGMGTLDRFVGGAHAASHPPRADPADQARALSAGVP
jgi:DNA-binding CsgD family transcriptional regulator